MGSFADKVLSRETGAPVPEEQARSISLIESPQTSFGQRVLERGRLQEQGIQTPGPREVEAGVRERGLAAQVGEQRLGQPGFEGFFARADIALSDTFDEKRRKFLDKFPGGDFIEVKEPDARTGRRRPQGTTVLFRRNKNEAFAEFDAPMLDRIELMGDLADLVGDAPAIAGELVVGKFTRAARLGQQLLAIGLGNLTGDAAKEAVEEARGFNLETRGEQAKRIGTRAAIAAGGGAASTVVTGPLNFAKGAPTIAVKPGAGAAQQAAARQGIPPLLPNQIASNPLIQRLGRQAAATTTGINNYIREQAKATVDAVSQLRDRDALRFAAGDFQRLHDDATKQILAGYGVAPGTKLTTLSEGGEALQQGVAQYENLSRAIVNRAYADARRIETPQFDLEPVLTVAKTVKAGKPGAGLTPEGEPPAGFISFAVDPARPRTLQLGPPTPQIKQQIDLLESLDPDLPTVTQGGVTMTGTDQLRAIRSNLMSLSKPGPVGLRTPEERQTAAQASQLVAAMNRTLENPTNANPQFVKAWQTANAEAKQRFDTLEKLIIMEATDTETPAQLAARLATPNQVDNLRTLEMALPEEQFKAFQSAVEADFIAPQNINGLTKRLDSFDRQTLNRLLPPARQRALRRVGAEMDRLNQAGIERALQRQSTVTAAVNDLTSRSDTAGLQQVIDQGLRFAPDSPQRRMMRAGLIENAWNKSVTREEGQLVINRAAFVDEVKRLRDTGLDRLLTSQDKAVLKDVDKIVDFLGSVADSGTSLQAASAAAGLRGLSRDALFTLIENIGTGRAFTNPAVQRVLLGTGAQATPRFGPRVLGAALALETFPVTDQEGTSTTPQ